MIDPKELEKQANRIIDSLQDQLPREVGATIFLFEYGDNRGLGFATTAKRHQMLTVIRNWLRDQDNTGPRIIT